MVTKIDSDAFELTPAIEADMLGMYEDGCTSTQVAVSLGLSLDGYIRACARIPQLQDVRQYGESIAQATLEALALEGSRGLIRNFNNTMLQFLLKNQYPHTYDGKKDDKPESESLLEQLTAGSLKLVREDL